MLPYKSGTVRVSSPFGNRTLNGSQEYHKGVDLVGTDKNIVTPVDGIVMQSRMVTDQNNLTWQWGNYICIQGKDGNYYYFCHLASRKAIQYQSVKAGDIIGVEGNTGYSFGSHLHFEVRSGSATGTSVNPCPFIGITNQAGTTYEVDGAEEETEETEDASDETTDETNETEDTQESGVADVTESDAKKLAKQNDVSDYALDPVVWALTNEILFGDGKNNLQLKNNCTREQMITFLYRLNELWEAKQK